MSGTSMDAVDAAIAEVSGAELRVLSARSKPMPETLALRLRQVAIPGVRREADTDLIDELGDLDCLVGELFAEAALDLLAATGLAPPAIRAIGSHGQTVRHRPRAVRPFTLQIGDPNIIAARTGIAVVADFRRRDMALGGQGAPLVPGFHAAVFASSDERRAVLNLGGIANLTMLEPGRPITGYDTGPANSLMDHWARRHLGRPFDDGGAWAASSEVSAPLLGALLTHPFLGLPPPKATGPEDFTPAWLDEAVARAGQPSPGVVQATLCEFTAMTIADALGPDAPRRLIVCGGGANNRHLLARLGTLLPRTAIESSEVHHIDPAFVEAGAFAWLAARTIAGLAGNVPTVTGASRAAVLGATWPADVADDGIASP
jgi:anhydro-N-acetylmuramic acid kinase